jgi:hypothetical protein
MRFLLISFWIAWLPCLALSPALAAPGSESGTSSRPAGFWRNETPWQMLGQAGAGIGMALIGGIVGANIGGKEADARCRERIDPDFSDECGWSALGGMVTGFAIGAPLGHALGAGLAGFAQGKRGVPYAMLGALVGDVVLASGAFALHDGVDGLWLPNGRLDPFLIGVTLLSMAAVPVATQSIFDYRLRYLAPTAAFSPRAGLRLGLVLAEAKF